MRLPFLPLHLTFTYKAISLPLIVYQVQYPILIDPFSPEESEGMPEGFEPLLERLKGLPEGTEGLSEGL